MYLSDLAEAWDHSGTRNNRVHRDADLFCKPNPTSFFTAACLWLCGRECMVDKCPPPPPLRPPSRWCLAYRLLSYPRYLSVQAELEGKDITVLVEGGLKTREDIGETEIEREKACHWLHALPEHLVLSRSVICARRVYPNVREKQCSQSIVSITYLAVTAFYY